VPLDRLALSVVTIERSGDAYAEGEFCDLDIRAEVAEDQLAATMEGELMLDRPSRKRDRRARSPACEPSR
jgi:hypothetical protein